MLFFSEAQILLSLDSQEMIGHGKPTLLGVDPQNEVHLSKQVSAALQGDILVYEETIFWSPVAFSPFSLDEQCLYGLVMAELFQHFRQLLLPPRAILPPPISTNHVCKTSVSKSQFK